MEIGEPISSTEQIDKEHVYMVIDSEDTPAQGAYGIFIYRGKIRYPGLQQMIVSYVDPETMEAGEAIPYDFEIIEKRVKEGKIVKVNLNKIEKNKLHLRRMNE